jgi:ring-1,2-phenylacetyl-CoA epoxidase subunit PaaE
MPAHSHNVPATSGTSAGAFLHLPMPQEGFYKKLRIKEIHEEVKGFKTFVFEDGHGIEYKSGQYITLSQTIKGEELRRSYSFTSSPELGEPLTIGVKRVENGLFSRQLIDDAKPGVVWTTTGAGGLFVLPADAPNFHQIFFFAAGSGITPVYALVKTILHCHPYLSVVLIYSNASPEKTVFFDALKKLSKQFEKRFNLELLYSNNPKLEKARLYRELLLELTDKLAVTEKAKTLFYVCGPESYMRMCIFTLQAIGVPKNNIRKENFVIHNVSYKNILPPDKEAHKVQIHFGDKHYEFNVEYPQSILKAAKKNGIQLPYSCEVGRCGNCVAKCVKGTVWHSYNEVLTDRELEQGLILTCVGHPVGGGVVLTLGST